MFSVGIVFLLLLIAGIIITFSWWGDKADAQNISSAASSDSQIYIVKDYNGKVAVFKDGDTEPVRTTQQQVDALPKTDRDMLNEGVTVTGDDELRRLIEDYCS